MWAPANLHNEAELILSCVAPAQRAVEARRMAGSRTCLRIPIAVEPGQSCNAVGGDCGLGTSSVLAFGSYLLDEIDNTPAQRLLKFHECFE
jgi:hypothetical protein